MGGVSSKTDPDKDLYVSLKISVPYATRSTTDNGKPGDSSDGTLDGEANENAVNSAIIYFYDANTGEYLYSFTANKDNGLSGENTSYTVITRVWEEPIRKLVGRSLNIYFLANPLSNYNYTQESDFLNSTISISGFDTNPVRAFGAGATGQLCPMANSSKYTVDTLSEITGTESLSYDALLEELNTVFSNDYENGKIWEIGKNNPLQLERQVARIDYKDENKNGNIYPLNGAECNATGNSSNLVYLKIVSLQLFNVGKEAYTFRHTQPLSTTEGGTNGSLQPFGIEKGRETGFYNWIADCDWNKKFKGSTTYSYYHQMSSTTDSEGKVHWNFTPVAATTAYTTTYDLKEWLINNKKQMTDYAPWYYVTENTVPSISLMNTQFATGISFRVLVCNASGNPLTVDNNKNLIITMPGGEFAELVKENAKTDPDNSSRILEPAGYYLTYKYLIEHNLEGNGSVNGATGGKNDLTPMQIGVVRNNVYRIRVAAINTLPDPDFGMEVYSYVIPWELRTDDDVLLK